MANSLSERLKMLQQMGYLQAGGGRPVAGGIGDALDNIGKGFNSATAGIKTGLDIRDQVLNARLAQEKAMREAQKQSSELTSMEELSPSYVPRRDIVAPLTPENATINESTTPEQRARIEELYARRAGIKSPNLAQDTEMAQNELRRAQANYYASGEKGGSKLYVNPKTREVSETPKPGFIEVSNNTAASIATQPTREGAAAELRSGIEMRKLANDYRKEFIDRPEVKEFVLINTQVKSMDAVLKNQLAGALAGNKQNQLAVDQALITMFNKLTDPNSVVRESEYARTPENLPIINRISGAIEKIGAGGAGMTNEDRQALVLGAKIIGEERGKTFNNIRNEYKKLSELQGVNPDVVVGTLKEFEGYGVGEKANPTNTPTKPTKPVKTESLDSYLKNKNIPDILKNKARAAKGLGRSDEEILKALKQDAGIK